MITMSKTMMMKMCYWLHNTQTDRDPRGSPPTQGSKTYIRIHPIQSNLHQPKVQREITVKTAAGKEFKWATSLKSLFDEIWFMSQYSQACYCGDYHLSHLFLNKDNENYFLIMCRFEGINHNFTKKLYEWENRWRRFDINLTYYVKLYSFKCDIVKTQLHILKSLTIIISIFGKARHCSWILNHHTAPTSKQGETPLFSKNRNYEKCFRINATHSFIF